MLHCFFIVYKRTVKVCFLFPFVRTSRVPAGSFDRVDLKRYKFSEVSNSSFQYITSKRIYFSTST